MHSCAYEKPFRNLRFSFFFINATVLVRKGVYR
jgi:hypothetical protein